MERGAAKPGYPLAAGHDTTSNLSNHVDGIRGSSIESSPSWTAVNRSNRLYSGVYSVTFTMDKIRNKIESYLTHEEWNKDLKNEGWLQS